jgi:hypothetical protein
MPTSSTPRTRAGDPYAFAYGGTSPGHECPMPTHRTRTDDPVLVQRAGQAHVGTRADLDVAGEAGMRRKRDVAVDPPVVADVHLFITKHRLPTSSGRRCGMAR